MAALYPLTLDAWNSLLGRINSLASYPPEGCDPVAPLSLITAPHKWSAEDITAAQDTLKEICSDNTFTTPTAGAPGSKWRKLYIDELEAAIDNGWCNCEPELPCCIPNEQGTVWIEGPGGGYYVTIPCWQVIEQYLYGNIDYGAAEAAFAEGVFAHLMECYNSGQGYIVHSYHHDHWVNCIYQDYWWEGDKRGEEHWSTCSNTESDVTYLARVPTLASNYQSNTVIGSNNYYGTPFLGTWYYDSIEQRWYRSCLIGYFEVDAYWYYFDFSLFRCPT